MMRRLFMLFMSIILLLGLSVPPPASANNAVTTSIPNPTLFKKEEPLQSISGKANNGNNETPGEWYIGTTPTNLLPNAPVLLFVPGLNNVAQIFWEDNDMYQTAVDAGYQTAFVQLHDAGGASADMWDNGALLADKIREISNHFGKPVTVVAYSKGGVDTQTALTHYGAWQYVQNVITLSSPHHGSQLADLAYSSTAGWLADLIGATGDGTYSMQMAYMADFRSQTDSQPRAYYNDYYTLGGTSWGSVFSSTWFGGMYLSSYGSNDGVVTAESSQLPGGELLAIGDWNHTSIRTGITFSVFDNYLSDNTNDGSKSMENFSDYVDKNTPSTNQWVTGGPLQVEKNTQIPITVEEHVHELTLNLLTTSDLAELKLLSPTGKVIMPNNSSFKIEEGIFLGALNNNVTIEKPEAGIWKLELTTKKDDAYLLVANYETENDLINFKKSKTNDASKIAYNITSNSKLIQEKTLQATYTITQSNNPSNTKTLFSKGDLSNNLTFDKPNEVYNITIEVKGLTINGKPFKRTIIDSVYTP
ncbi:esterase/lipase family protein [Paucisalibacillus globulus]|uniref:esterase/lipase family protein n=1 Tax=Paucisalibacillus globulus TaxID=351095 RepID=UPI000421B2CC|nr:hypothetical protein [Paucisalibacillus globulus]